LKRLGIRRWRRFLAVMGTSGSFGSMALQPSAYTDKEWTTLTSTSSVFERSIRLSGSAIPEALIRQAPIPGFDQTRYSRAHVLCVGAGGLTSHVVPGLARTGIGALTIVDDDFVEASNLNRQMYYRADIGRPKAIALVRNLQRECTVATRLAGYVMRLQDALDARIHASANVVVCAVDNNPTRVLASTTFRALRIPVIFMAVSRHADHGYVFVQDAAGPCFGCVFPDAVDDQTYPCPGTPAMIEILQVVGALALYAIDSCITSRPRTWAYRSAQLINGVWDSSYVPLVRTTCPLGRH
jgi:molybdopterin/thiamine biosynthesis adenylyltransferase